MNPLLIPLAFFGALTESSATFLQKRILRWHKATIEDNITYIFLAIVLISFPLMLFFWKMDMGALAWFSLGILFLIVIISILANIFNVSSLKKETLSELEPMKLFQPLFVILFALILYPSERTASLGIIIAALIASSALVVSHIKKDEFKMNKYMWLSLGGSMFFGLELALSKFILPFYNPLSFYFVRSFLIFIVTLFIFRKHLTKVTRATSKLYLLSGLGWVLFRGLLYYGYTIFGVVFTTLIFMLTPIFIYSFSKIFLKEKISKRNIYASIIIVTCVAYALWVGH